MNAFSVVAMLLLELFRSGDLTHLAPPFAVDTWSLLLFTVGIDVVVAMAFLSQVLADKVNRWLNIVVGAVFSAGAIVTTVMSLIDTPSALAINSAAGALWTALIVWYAWKSK
jgi:uncharacterized transporter YbjL